MTLDEYQSALAPPACVSEPLTIVQLQDLLINTYGGNEALLQAEFAKFSCVRNPDIQEFLQNKALQFEKAHKSRTYLAVSEVSLSSESPDLEIFRVFRTLAQTPGPWRGCFETQAKAASRAFSTPRQRRRGLSPWSAREK